MNIKLDEYQVGWNFNLGQQVMSGGQYGLGASISVTNGNSFSYSTTKEDFGADGIKLGHFEIEWKKTTSKQIRVFWKIPIYNSAVKGYAEDHCGSHITFKIVIESIFGEYSYLPPAMPWGSWIDSYYSMRQIIIGDGALQYSTSTGLDTWYNLLPGELFYTQ
jgi:hypothetical protein